MSSEINKIALLVKALSNDARIGKVLLDNYFFEDCNQRERIYGLFSAKDAGFDIEFMLNRIKEHPLIIEYLYEKIELAIKEKGKEWFSEKYLPEILYECPRVYDFLPEILQSDIELITQMLNASERLLKEKKDTWKQKAKELSSYHSHKRYDPDRDKQVEEYIKFMESETKLFPRYIHKNLIHLSKLNRNVYIKAILIFPHTFLSDEFPYINSITLTEIQYCDLIMRRNNSTGSGLKRIINPISIQKDEIDILMELNKSLINFFHISDDLIKDPRIAQKIIKLEFTSGGVGRRIAKLHRNNLDIVKNLKSPNLLSYASKDLLDNEELAEFKIRKHSYLAYQFFSERIRSQFRFIKMIVRFKPTIVKILSLDRDQVLELCKVNGYLFKLFSEDYKDDPLVAVVCARSIISNPSLSLDKSEFFEYAFEPYEFEKIISSQRSIRGSILSRIKVDSDEFIQLASHFPSSLVYLYGSQRKEFLGNKNSYLAILQNNPSSHRFLSKVVKDRQYWMSYIQGGGYNDDNYQESKQYFPEELWQDIDFVRDCITSKTKLWYLLDKIPIAFLKEDSIASKIMGCDLLTYNYEKFLLACKKYHLNKQWLNNLKTIKKKVEEDNHSSWFSFFIQLYPDRKDIAKIVLEKNGLLIHYCSDELKRDKEITSIALKNNAKAIKYIDEPEEIEFSTWESIIESYPMGICYLFNLEPIKEDDNWFSTLYN